MIQKAMRSLTFRSLCFPDAIKARGVDSPEGLPYYYYKDERERVWEAPKSFCVEHGGELPITLPHQSEGMRKSRVVLKMSATFEIENFDCC